jgi:hypothetical protein
MVRAGGRLRPGPRELQQTGRGVLMGVLEDVPTAEHLAALAEEVAAWGA